MTSTITCLYVDDEPRLLELAQEFLGSTGLHIITCDSPSTAKDVLSKGGIDVIISDYQMPDMDGIEFLRFVRGGGVESEIPFILFTGKGREEVAIMALNAGADFYLSKGGDPRSQFAELENAIRQLTRRKEAEGAISYNARRFRRIIENVLDIVFIMNEEGTINYASPSVRKILGYSPRELIGTNGLSLVHPSDHPQNATIDQVTAISDTGPLEFRMRAKNGRARWFEGVMKAFPSEHGRGDVIVSAWNIDERKRLELEVQNRERTLRAVFDNSN